MRLTQFHKVLLVEEQTFSPTYLPFQQSCYSLPGVARSHDANFPSMKIYSSFLPQTSLRNIERWHGNIYLWWLYKATYILRVYQAEKWAEVRSITKNKCRISSSFVHWDFSSVQFSHSVVSDSGTPWTAACHASLSITIETSQMGKQALVREAENISRYLGAGRRKQLTKTEMSSPGSRDLQKRGPPWLGPPKNQA